MAEHTHTYDIAVSFSGKQRDYVEAVVRECEALGVRVFYDRNATVELWGTNVVPSLREVYGGISSRFFIPFLSHDYAASAYPMDEFMTAMTAAVERQYDYILPVVMDDFRMPPHLLNPAVIYLVGSDYTPAELAQAIHIKLKGARATGQQTRDVSSALAQMLEVRLPKLPPADFSPQATLDAALAHVGERFRASADNLLQHGYTCRVRASVSAVTVLVTAQGNSVCELALREGTTLGPDQLDFVFAWPRISYNGINGTVAATWDPDAGQPALLFHDYTAFGSGNHSLPDADALFAALWEKIIRHLENTHR